jgi:hypothetical protein
MTESAELLQQLLDGQAEILKKLNAIDIKNYVTQTTQLQMMP